MTNYYGQPTPPMNNGIRWQDPANLLLAIWLFISPWVLQFGSGVSASQEAAGGAAATALSNAAWNAWVLAVIVGLVAISAMGRFARGQEVLNLLLGAWIFVAPWALGFASNTFAAAAWDHWFVGALVFLISASTLTMTTGQRRSMASSLHHEPMRR